MSHTLFFVIIGILMFLTVLGAVYINLSSNTIYATFSMIIIFFCISFILLLINVEFLGLVYLTVYIGAIAVFFIFVLLLFDLRVDHVLEKSLSRLPNPSPLVMLISASFTVIFELFCRVSFRNKNNPEALQTWAKLWELILGKPFGRGITTSNDFSDPIFLRNFLNKYHDELSKVPQSEFDAKCVDYLLNELNYHNSHSVYNLGYVMYNEYYFLVIICACILLLSMVGGLALVINTPYKRLSSVSYLPMVIERKEEKLKIEKAEDKINSLND